MAKAYAAAVVEEVTSYHMTMSFTVTAEGIGVAIRPIAVTLSPDSVTSGGRRRTGVAGSQLVEDSS